MKLRLIAVLLTLFWALAGVQAASAGCVLTKLADLPVTMTGMRPMVHAKINGKDANLIFDSGAFYSMVTPAAARKFGLKPSVSAPIGMRLEGVGGAGGVSVGQAANFDLADSHFHDVDFLVGEKSLGAGEDGVLGRNIVGVADVEYDLANGVIRLFLSKGCEHFDMAYWAGAQPYSMIDTFSVQTGLTDVAADASIDGAKLAVLFDTGSPVSMADSDAAARAGIDTGAPPSEFTSGVTRDSYIKTWIAPVDSFKLGDEEIKHTRLRFAPLGLSGVQMLIGADFFLSHRVYVQHAPRRLFFTYNGGPVFNLVAEPPKAAVAPSGSDRAAYADTPSDADGFSRRAAASLSRRDYADAIADLDQAVKLDPAEAKYVYDRGVAEARAGQSDKAMADFEQALKLKPGDVDALMARAGMEAAGPDKSAARRDLDAIDHLLASDAPARLQLAGLYQATEDYPAGIGQLDLWIAAHPGDGDMAQALNARCWLRALADQALDQALADCNAALKLDPGSPMFLDSRGLVRLRLGDLDRSIADYRAALALMPNSAWTLYGRGLAEKRKGEAGAGDADIAAAVKLDADIAAKARAVGLTP